MFGLTLDRAGAARAFALGGARVWPPGLGERPAVAPLEDAEARAAVLAWGSTMLRMLRLEGEMDTDKAQLAALGAAPVRDPLTDPVRGDVISYGAEGGESLFVVTVTWASSDEVAYRGVELWGVGEDEDDEQFHGLDNRSDWRDWSGLTDVTVLRRGDA